MLFVHVSGESGLLAKQIFFLPSLKSLIGIETLLPPLSPHLSLSLSLPLSLVLICVFDVEFKAAANVFFIGHTFVLSVLPTASMQSGLKENSNDFGLMGL